MPDAKWYASWVRMIPAQTAPEKMRNLEAADLIESLSTKLEHVGRECDALLRDLRDADQCVCSHCKHFNHCLVEEAEDVYEDHDYVCSACHRDDCPCKTCASCSNWEWRGAE